MAQGLPSNIYSGGAVRINSDKFLNYYLQQQAHEQAQKEAAIKYIGDLGGRLTTTGVSSDDLDDFMKQKNEWQSHAIANKDYLANTRLDNGAAYMENNQRYNQAQETLQKSKAKSEFALKILKPILADPKRNSLLTAETNERIHDALRPVNDPMYRPMSEDEFKYKDKPFDNKEDMRYIRPQLKDIKGEYIPDRPVRDMKSGTQTTTSNLKFRDNEINAMRNIAHVTLGSNKSFQNMMMEDLSDPTSPIYSQRNATYREQTGKDIGETGDPVSDMATAYMIEQNPTQRQKISNPVKITQSPDEMNAINYKWWKLRESVRQGNRVANKELSRRYQLEDEAGKSEDVNDVLSDDIRHAEQNRGKEETITTPEGKEITLTPIPLDPLVKSVYQFQDAEGVHRKDPSMVGIDEDGNRWSILKSEEGKNKGQVIGAKQIDVEPLRVAIKNSYFGKQKHFAPKAPTSSDKKDLKKFGSLGIDLSPR